MGTSIEKLLGFLIATAIHFPDAYYKYLIEVEKVKPELAKELVFEKQITFSDLGKLLDENSKFPEVIRRVFKNYPEPIALRWKNDLSSFQINKAILDGIDNRLRFIVKDSLIPLFEGNKFDIVQIIKEKKRVLMPLTVQSFGKISRKMITKFLLAELWFYAQSITDEKERQEVILFIDEFQNAQMEIVDQILSEARKYKIRLILGNQYFGQLWDNIKSSIIGNVSTLFAFNIGNLEEAKYIPPLFRNKITAEDIASLPPFKAYLKTLSPEGDRDIAFMSYKTMDYETAHPLLHSEKDLQQLNEKSLTQYGEETSVLMERHKRKHENPVDYFLKVSEKQTMDTTSEQTEVIEI